MEEEAEEFKMEGLIEVVQAEELFSRGELHKEDRFEVDKFENTKIMRFRARDDAVEFARGFVLNYLIPKYGKEKATKFPMAKSGPQRVLRTPEEASAEMGRFIGCISENQNRETWLVIPTERYDEVEEYIKSLK